MTTRTFVQQIEWLLFTGAIEGNQILTLHEQLQRYQWGSISDVEMQTAIDDVDLIWRYCPTGKQTYENLSEVRLLCKTVCAESLSRRRGQFI